MSSLNVHICEFMRQEEDDGVEILPYGFVLLFFTTMKFKIDWTHFCIIPLLKRWKLVTYWWICTHLAQFNMLPGYRVEVAVWNCKKRMMEKIMSHHVEAHLVVSMRAVFITNIMFFFAGYNILCKFYLLIISQYVVLALVAHSIERTLLDEISIAWRYKNC